jgi:hypothetical protein
VQKATPGQIVLVTIDPDRNGGQDHAPALITAVAGDGTATVLVFHADTTTHAASGIELHEDRAAVDELDEHQRPSCAAYWPPAATEVETKRTKKTPAGSDTPPAG